MRELIKRIRGLETSRDEHADAVAAGREARKLADRAGHHFEAAATMLAMNNGATPISRALYEVNAESAVISQDCGREMMRLHDAIFLNMKDRPGFKEGYNEVP
jgi:hypothetical protein